METFSLLKYLRPNINTRSVFLISLKALNQLRKKPPVRPIRRVRPKLVIQNVALVFVSSLSKGKDDLINAASHSVRAGRCFSRTDVSPMDRVSIHIPQNAARKYTC